MDNMNSFCVSAIAVERPPTPTLFIVPFYALENGKAVICFALGPSVDLVEKSMEDLSAYVNVRRCSFVDSGEAWSLSMENATDATTIDLACGEENISVSYADLRSFPDPAPVLHHIIILSEVPEMAPPLIVTVDGDEKLRERVIQEPLPVGNDFSDVWEVRSCGQLRYLGEQQHVECEKLRPFGKPIKNIRNMPQFCEVVADYLEEADLQKLKNSLPGVNASHATSPDQER
eukprot:m.2173 g.2173  ORF g.2173 m.2173 type:complete len:231 (+) comp8381_c0_seq2:724-1416(+)